MSDLSPNLPVLPRVPDPPSDYSREWARDLIRSVIQAFNILKAPQPFPVIPQDSLPSAKINYGLMVYVIVGTEKKLAISDGTQWVYLPTPSTSGGSVTSVDVSGGDTGLTTSGGPVTSTGVITLDGTLNASSGGTGRADLSTGLIRGDNTDPVILNATVDLVTEVENQLLIVNGGTSASTPLQARTNLGIVEHLGWKLNDEITSITTGTSVVTDYLPCDCTIISCFIGLSAVSTSGVVTIDVLKNGSSIFSTPPSIDANENTNLTGTLAVLRTTTGLKGDKITFDITAAGTGAKGPLIWLEISY